MEYMEKIMYEISFRHQIDQTKVITFYPQQMFKKSTVYLKHCAQLAIYYYFFFVPICVVSPQLLLLIHGDSVQSTESVRTSSQMGHATGTVWGRSVC